MSFNKSGSKYLRAVPCITEGRIDVYAVLDAFAVTCPARQHAIKKLLCSGIRGKGDTIQDLREAADAANRAVQMEELRQSFSLFNTPIGTPAPYGGTPTKEFTPWVGIAKRSSIAASQCPSCARSDCAAGQYPVTKDGGCEGYIKAEPEGADNCARYNPSEKTCMGKPHMDCYRCVDYAPKASLCHSCHADNCTKIYIAACEETGECEGYISALRENMLDAKQETSGPEQIGQNCNTAWCVNYSQLFLRNCQKYGSEEIKGCAYYHKTPDAKQEAPTAADLPTTHTDPSTNCKDCHNAACVGKGRNLTCDQGCERFIPKEASL